MRTKYLILFLIFLTALSAGFCEDPKTSTTKDSLKIPEPKINFLERTKEHECFLRLVFEAKDYKKHEEAIEKEENWQVKTKDGDIIRVKEVKVNTALRKGDPWSVDLYLPVGFDKFKPKGAKLTYKGEQPTKIKKTYQRYSI